MRKHILTVIKQIELDYHVKILYACESGSRAWGFPSKDSDYDVRFIYIHKQNWYLSIDQKKDVIEISKDESISIPVNELLDVSGWEFTKALKLYRKSNPSLLEWMSSSIVYYQYSSAIEKMRELDRDFYAPNSSVYHYLGMAKRNYQDYFQRKKKKPKNLFYILRPILAALWIEKYNAFPPIEFHKLMDALVPIGELKEQILILIHHKIVRDELNSELRIEVIKHFLDLEIKRLENYARSLKIEIQDPTERLNELFIHALEEAWSFN